MSVSDLELEPASTALVLVDLQNFTVGLDLKPLTGAEVLSNCVRLAHACRDAGVLVVLVRVGHESHSVPIFQPRTDTPPRRFELTAEAREIPPELGPKPGDVVVDKYNWGAFFGTNLDVHLRRRKITTLIMAGLVTDIGLDTTMREGMARGYDQVIASDGASSFTSEQHEYVLRHIAPRLSQVRATDEIVAALTPR